MSVYLEGHNSFEIPRDSSIEESAPETTQHEVNINNAVGLLNNDVECAIHMAKRYKEGNAILLNRSETSNKRDSILGISNGLNEEGHPTARSYKQYLVDRANAYDAIRQGIMARSPEYLMKGVQLFKLEKEVAQGKAKKAEKELEEAKSGPKGEVNKTEYQNIQNEINQFQGELSDLSSESSNINTLVQERIAVLEKDLSNTDIGESKSRLDETNSSIQKYEEGIQTLLSVKPSEEKFTPAKLDLEVYKPGLVEQSAK